MENKHEEACGEQGWKYHAKLERVSVVEFVISEQQRRVKLNIT